MRKSSRPYKASKDDQTILDEMMERYDYAKQQWSPIFDEGDVDMNYIAGQTWDQKDKDQRTGRLTLTFDQIGQYLNQVVNAWRQNKRAIRVTPRGSGSTDKTAEILGNRIRQIEYESKAQEAYIAAFSGALERSTGFCRIVAEFEKGKSFNKVLRIKAIPNPRQCLPDPDAESIAGADWKYFFYVYAMSRKEFERKWPDAKTGSFSPDLNKSAPDWHQENRVLVAEYWTVTQKQKKLLLVGTSEADGVAMFDEEYQQLAEKQGLPPGVKIVYERMADVPYVCKYITNGVELLEGDEQEDGTRQKKYEWPGQHIPFASCYGKILYMSDQGSAKKIILSFIRLARDAQKYFNWLKSEEAGLIKMPARSALWARRGQMNATEIAEAQDSLNNPKVVLFYGSTSEDTGQQILNAPERDMPAVNIQAYEIAAEAARRDIQNALGRYSASVGRADTNVKSGVALKQLDQQSDQGSYHFTDAGDAMVEHIGEMLLDLIPYYDDTAKDITIRDAADKVSKVRVNDPVNHTYIDPDTRQPIHVNLSEGEHLATIGTGPAVDSERELASGFADSLMVNMRQIEPVIGQQATAKLLALTVKLKALGPIGDEMVATISPDDPNGSPQKMAHDLQGAKQQIQHAEQAMQQLAGKLKDAEAGNQAMLDKAKIETESRERIASADRDYEAIEKAKDRAARIEEARISAAKQSADLAAEMREEAIALASSQVHEAGMAAADAGHEQLMAGQAHQQAIAQDAHAGMVDATLADQGQGHALEQGQQAADLAPPPAEAQAGA